MIRIQNNIQPKDLETKLKRFWELSAKKIHSIEQNYDPNNGAPVFTENGSYTSRGWTEWTHGFQFGIEIPGFIKWSPVQYVYKQWAGSYKHINRYVYVNRGFGFHAFPGRVGIWPEITVLELKKKNV